MASRWTRIWCVRPVTRSSSRRVLEHEAPGGAVAVDLGHQLRGEGVDDGGADAVQPARRRVGAGPELAAGVQLGEHHLEPGTAVALAVDGDAAAVVGHLDRAVAVEHHVDVGGEATGRLVDRVVDDLPHQLMEAVATGAADVHPRPLADRFEPFEDLDLRRVV
jgi:hypothetical protein